LIKALIILIPDPLNVLNLFYIRKDAVLLTVLDYIRGCVFPDIRNIDKFFEGTGIDVNFIIYSVAVDKVDNIGKKRVPLERDLQERAEEDNANE
jgi:hypothetical protein